MISVEYDTFTITTNKQAPGTFSIYKTGGKGSIPIALTGAYTSVGVAKADIDRYRARTKEAYRASKTNSAGRVK